MNNGDEGIRKVFTEQDEVELGRINKIFFPEIQRGIKAF